MFNVCLWMDILYLSLFYGFPVRLYYKLHATADQLQVKTPDAFNFCSAVYPKNRVKDESQRSIIVLVIVKPKQ